MAKFVQQRHRPPVALQQPRQLVLACPPMHSAVNLSRLVRLAGCFGLTRMIACGAVKVDRNIARDAVDYVRLERPRTLGPALRRMRAEGYQLVGLEQAAGSECLFQFAFQQRTVLVVGHERIGLAPDVLELLDRVAEIPVYGPPYSFNAATAAAMAVYEYCRQFPGP